MKTPQPNSNVLNLNRMDDKGSQRDNVLRLDKNERTYPFKKTLIKKILSENISNGITMYPNQNTIYDLLSKKNKVDKENILLSAGSDAGLKHIFETYLSKKDSILFLSPTYAMVEVYANLYEVKKNIIKFDKNNFIPVDLIINTLIKSKPKCFFLANPNQPTGTYIHKQNIKKIINTCKIYKILLILDHAYFDFISKKDKYNSTKEVKSNPFIIFLNTFSKSYGLAGLRLGYIISCKKNISQLYKVKSYSDINYFSILFASYLLKNNRILKDHIRETEKSKKKIKVELDKYKNHFIIVDSYTNFIHMRFKSKLTLNKIYNFLVCKKIILRINHKGLPATIDNSLRITLPSLPQTLILVKAIKSFFNKFDE